MHRIDENIKFGGFAPNDVFNTIAELNLELWYGIAICICTRKQKLADFYLAVKRHIAKQPNFPAIRYVTACPMYSQPEFSSFL